ncbi:MAG: DUF6252 family protein [Bacteroidota bacterium]
MLNNKFRSAVWLCTSLTIIICSCNGTDTAISTLPNCEDGIRNNGEREIDCGGKSCQPCPAKMDALVDGTPWSLFGSTITSQVNTSSSSIFISGTDSVFRSISLIHAGSFSPGTYNLNGGLYNTPSGSFTTSTGTITISVWDTTERYIEGFFSFTAYGGNGDSVRITNGGFAFAPY